MFVTVHVLAGAELGQRVGHPVAAFAAGLGSHVVLDCVPHWGIRDEARFLRAARVDGLAGLGAIVLGLAAIRPARRRAAAAGIVGAVLLDLDKPGRHFFGVSPFPDAVDAFHVRIQAGRESPRWWPTEAITAVVLLRLLARSAAVGHGRDRIFAHVVRRSLPSRASATSREMARKYFLR